MFKNFLHDERAATAVEYGLIVAVLSLTIIAGLNNVTNAIEFMFGNNTSRLNQALDR